MKGNSSALIHRVTYQTRVKNISDQPLFNLRVFLAFPPPLPPRQNLVDLKMTPRRGQQATDLIGNHWIDFSLDRLPARELTTFGYTALIRNLAIEYLLPYSRTNKQVPDNLVAYMNPENFIESHHHLVKDLAHDIAKNNPTPLKFAKAAMQTVSEMLQYAPQKYERGAAFAIENRKGDCTEFSALFAALCRANRIPARLEAGFAFNGKKWERHAWVNIWLYDQWIPTDPTWYGKSGWLGVTNRHIPLIIGNWMDTRIHQEFKVTWSQHPKTLAPKISTIWKVTKVIGLQSSL